MTQDRARYEERAQLAAEQWEVTIEDGAQVLALLLRRGQAAMSVLADFWRTRPILVAGLVAAVIGTIVGTIVASRRARGSPPQTAERGSALSQAGAVAQAAAQRLGRAGPLPRRNGMAPAAREGARRAREARYLAELVPMAAALFRNPLVRRIAWRLALRAFRAR